MSGMTGWIEVTTYDDLSRGRRVYCDPEGVKPLRIEHMGRYVNREIKRMERELGDR